jgi:RNA polymerase sporulation-specific sigma factor
LRVLKALSTEENVELLVKAKSGDLEARELFFAHNYRLIIHMATKKSPMEMSTEDSISACQFGFLKAYNSFDFSKAVKFATYAAKCMQNEIWMFWRGSKKHLRTGSIDAPLHISEEGDNLTLVDVLVNPQSESCHTQIESDALNDVLDQYCIKASLRERQIIQMRYADRMTQRQVSSALNISQSYVSRLDKQIIGKLRVISKHQMNGVTEKMAVKIYVGKLRWLFENTKLSNAMITGILDISIPTVIKYRKFFEMGQIDTVADDSIAYLVDAGDLKKTKKSITERNEERRQAQQVNTASIPATLVADESASRWTGKSFTIRKEEEKKVELKEKEIELKIPNSVDELIKCMEQEETAKEKITDVVDPVETEIKEPIGKYPYVDSAKHVTASEKVKDTKINPVYLQEVSNIQIPPETISLTLESVNSFNVLDTFQYLHSQLHKDKKYRISVRIEQVK